MAKKKARAKAKKAKAKTKPKSKLKTKSRAKAKPRVAAKPKKAASKPKAKAKVAKPMAAAPAPAKTPSALPSMEVETTNNGKLNLASLKGKNVVLYFYPKDDTPGCTIEGCDIRDRFPEFQRRDTIVLGVSRDDMASHEKFKAKFGFPFELITDPDEKLSRSFDVIKKKSLYGKEYMGIDRSTFIFDKEGKLRKEWRGVKVEGHAEEILGELNKL